MQIILLENIMKLGKIGDQVEVKNGFGRNYLLKQGKALSASKENLEFVNKKKTELNNCFLFCIYKHTNKYLISALNYSQS